MQIPAQIFQICSSERTRPALDPGFIPLDNIANPRPDWYEYTLIRQHILAGVLADEKAYYGFIPNDFKAKTGIGSELVNAFAASSSGQADVITFAPFYDLQAFFRNTFEEGEFRHPGLMKCASDVAAKVMPSVDLPRLVMDSGSALLGNYFIAKPAFWRRWFAVTESLFDIAENDHSSLGVALTQVAARSSKQFKVCLMERTASLILAVERHWRVIACDPFRLLNSGIEPFCSERNEAIVLDALKAAYLRYAFPEFIEQFCERRKPFFQRQEGRPSEPGVTTATVSTEPNAEELLRQFKKALDLGELSSALSAADELIANKHFDLVHLVTLATALDSQAMRSDAIRLYRDWIALSASPAVFVARFNLGVMLSESGDLAGAEREYRAALSLNPRFAQAQLNLASVLERLGKPTEAIAEWENAVSTLDKSDTDLLIHAYNNLGRILEQQHRYGEADAMLTESLKLKPKQPSVIWHWVHLRQKQCKWPVYEAISGIPAEEMLANSSTLALLAASDDPSVQYEAARRYVQQNVPSDLPKLAPSSGYSHSRLRVGYLSSNFGMHAVSLLTAELYELHDRQRVEVYGYCWSPEDGTPLRARVVKAMDRFTRITGLSDEAAAKKIREDEIDILVDLQGLTSGCRPQILARRPAPVQVTYLGFPGPTALPCVDYVLADRYVLPDDLVPFFSERPLYMPDCFQVNDRQRIPNPTPPRQQCGLPDGAFVFCAFNNNYKFTPDLFAIWMRILSRAPNAVLWLLADNEPARQNLLAAAKTHGITENRLVFGPRVPLQDYWARYPLADLFLDTFPFNGGTTVSDALWMGVPVLTCSGRTFASRMAGSLLHAVGLSDLITPDFNAYEEMAVHLATQPEIAAELRDRLRKGRQNGSLFDTPTFVRNLEDVFQKIAMRPEP